MCLTRHPAVIIGVGRSKWCWTLTGTWTQLFIKGTLNFRGSIGVYGPPSSMGGEIRMHYFAELWVESHKVQRQFGSFWSPHYKLHSRTHLIAPSARPTSRLRLLLALFFETQSPRYLPVFQKWRRHSLPLPRFRTWDQPWAQYTSVLLLQLCMSQFLSILGRARLSPRLYGITNVQVYFYVRKYRQDRTMLKCVVAFLWYVNYFKILCKLLREG